MSDDTMTRLEPPPDPDGYVDALLNDGADVIDFPGQISGRQAVDRPAAVALPGDALAFPTDGSETSPIDNNQIIKGLIAPKTSGSLVGPSGVGKTTCCLEMCFRIALGENYHGLKVPKARPVLYVNYEGAEGFKNRASAAVRRYGDPGTMFAWLTITPTLNRSDDGAKGAELVLLAVRELQRINGQPIGLTVIDTKARATAGDDENSASDAANYLEHRVKRITDNTGCAVLTVHHTGKNPELGGRGSSALPAGDDFRFLINKEREVTIDKARDGKCDYVLFSYDLEEIGLRSDEDGDQISACVITAKTGVAKSAKRLSKQESRALEMLIRLFNDDHGKIVPAAAIDLEGIERRRLPKVVEIELWRQKCAEARLVPDGKAASEAKAFTRAIAGLEKANRVCRYGQYVWLLNQRHSGQDGTKADNVPFCPNGEAGQNGQAS